MLGMMIGMTQGMMTGIAIGYFIGAATDMFVSNLVGVIVGLLFGIVFGRVGGLMGMLDGAAMGGMMGAMLGVMLQYLYNGWAVTITSVLMSAIYLVSCSPLCASCNGCAAISWRSTRLRHAGRHKNVLAACPSGQTYYFCAPSCQRAFSKSPEMYLKEKKI